MLARSAGCAPPTSPKAVLASYGSCARLGEVVVERRHNRERCSRWHGTTPPGGVGRRPLERGSHERDGSGKLAEHEPSADADDAKARALQLAIATSVRAWLARVNGAIDLDDELDARCQEISDEEPATGT